MPTPKIIMIAAACYRLPPQPTFDTSDASDDVWEKLGKLVGVENLDHFVNRCLEKHSHALNTAKELLSVLKQTALTSEKKKEFATQLEDGAIYCDSGFRIRMNSILVALFRPTTIDAFLAHMRFNLVQTIAYRTIKNNTQSVHGVNAFFMAAKDLNLGVSALDSSDQYAGWKFAHFDISNIIQTYFLSNYTPLNILNELPILLEHEFEMYYGYDITAKNGLTNGSYESILNFFKKMFNDEKIALDDVFNIDQETSMIQSIKWQFVLNRLVKILHQKYMIFPPDVLTLFEALYGEDEEKANEGLREGAHIALLQELNLFKHSRLLSLIPQSRLINYVLSDNRQDDPLLDKRNRTALDLILTRASKADLKLLFPTKLPMGILIWTINYHPLQLKNVFKTLTDPNLSTKFWYKIVPYLGKKGDKLIPPMILNAYKKLSTEDFNMVLDITVCLPKKKQYHLLMEQDDSKETVFIHAIKNNEPPLLKLLSIVDQWPDDQKQQLLANPELLLQIAKESHSAVVLDLFSYLLKQKQSDSVALYQILCPVSDAILGRLVSMLKSLPREQRNHELLYMLMKDAVNCTTPNNYFIDLFRLLDESEGIDQMRRFVEFISINNVFLFPKLLKLNLSHYQDAELLRKNLTVNPLLIHQYISFSSYNNNCAICLNNFLKELLTFSKEEIEKQLLVQDEKGRNVVQDFFDQGIMYHVDFKNNLINLLKKLDPDAQKKILISTNGSNRSVLESFHASIPQEGMDAIERLSWIKQLSESIQRSYLQKNIGYLWINSSLDPMTIFKDLSLSTQEAALQSLRYFLIQNCVIDVLCTLPILPFIVLFLPSHFVSILKPTNVIHQDLNNKIMEKIKTLSSSTASEVEHQLARYLNTLTNKRLGRSKQAMILDALDRLKSSPEAPYDATQINVALTDPKSELNQALSFERLSVLRKKPDQTLQDNAARLNPLPTSRGFSAESRTRQTLLNPADKEKAVTLEGEDHKQHLLKEALIHLKEGQGTPEASLEDTSNASQDPLTDATLP